MKSHIDLNEVLGRKTDKQMLGDHGNTIKQRWERVKRSVKYSDTLASLLALSVAIFAGVTFGLFTLAVIVFFKLLGLLFWCIISWIICACFFDGLTFEIGNRTVDGWLVVGTVLYALHSVFGPRTYLKQDKK